MHYNSILLTLFCYFVAALSVTLGPCKKEDAECFSNSVNQVVPFILKGIPSLDVESSDPLFVELIESDITTLKLKVINSTVNGFTKCILTNAKLDLQTLRASTDANCPGVSVSGLYEVSGTILDMPVEGKGPYNAVTGRYYFFIDAEIKIINGEDGKTYMNIKDFNIKPEALDPVKFDLKNLFNGQKNLANAAIKFGNDNWKEIVNLIQLPLLEPTFKKMFNNCNKYLRTQPLEEIFVN